MKEGVGDLVKYRFEKARNTLNDAHLYFNSATLESIVNRIYYAIFYSVTALLLTRGLSSAKHSGVRSLFNKEFVKKGLVDTALANSFQTCRTADRRAITRTLSNSTEKKLHSGLQRLNCLSLRLKKSLSKMFR